MVWFQCDDCGENLKKPKLALHFNRCSARKLSCIDCGVVFDRQSVQAHTACVSEVEKYGPKGVSKPANLAATQPKSGKAQSGPEVDLSRGLTQRPPWSCSLCNVKATSREALDLHAQGRKHRSRAKAAAAKQAPPVDAKDALVGKMEVDNCSPANKIGAGESTSPVDASTQPPEKKRKNEQVDGAGEAEGVSKPSRKDKKAKKESLNSDVDSKRHEVAGDSPCKKRKHVEEEQESVSGLESKGSGKKSKKRDKLSVLEENGHTSAKVPEVPEVAEVQGIDQEEKKDKKGRKGKKVKEEAGNGNDHQTVVDETANQGSLMNGASSAHDTDAKGECATPSVDGRKVKKGKGMCVVEESVMPERVETAQEEKSKGEKKKHKKTLSKPAPNEETPRKEREKETIVHEVSFREWLEDDDTGGNGGTPTHPSMVEKSGEDTPAEPTDLDNERIQAVSKVVKWKKVIREALVKSPDGRMKRKELSKAVLSVALKAAEVSSVPLDKTALKEELMKQIKCNPKFIFDGKHVMLAPKAN